MANYYGSSFTYGGTVGDYGYGAGVGSAGAIGSQANQGVNAAYGSYSTLSAQQQTQYGPYGQKIAGAGNSGPSAHDAGYGVYGGAASTDSYRTQHGGDNYYRQGNGSSDRPTAAYTSYQTTSTNDSYTRGRGVHTIPARTGSSGYSGLSQYAGGTKSGSEWTSSSRASSSAAASDSAASTEPSVVDAVVYSAATNLLQGGRSGGGGQRMSWKERFRVNGPPDPSQWKYCDLCKCSCAGPQAYKMHLEGRAHKKKEAQLSNVGGSVASKDTSGGLTHVPPGHYFCPVCDVPCSSADAYEAHIRGAKHQKVVRLQMRMGKEIPTVEGGVVQTSAAGGKSAQIVKFGPEGKKTVLAAPKISFVGGTKLQSTALGMQEVASELTPSSQQSDTSSASSGMGLIGPVKPAAASLEEDYGEYSESVQPVGLEYIEESLNPTKTAVMFFCKLCDCSFTDAQAKNMHSKGRRHRMAYKKKVDPSLVVDMKPGMSSGQLERLKRRPNVNEPWIRREIRNAYKAEAEALMYEREVLQWQLMKTLGQYLPEPGPRLGSGPMLVHRAPVAGRELSIRDMRPNLIDERDLITKHNEIYPTDDEIAVIKSTMEDCEKGLKLVSDFLMERDMAEQKPEVKQEKTEDVKEKSKSDASTKPAEGSEVATTEDKEDKAEEEAIKPQPPRIVKGVMRVGPLAKTLLLHGQLDLDVVVLCSERPTYALVKEISEILPKQLETFAEKKYVVKLSPDGNRIIMTHATVEGSKPLATGEPSAVEEPPAPHATCYISLTSPAVSPTAAQPESAGSQAPKIVPAVKPTGVLKPGQKVSAAEKLAQPIDEKICLGALAALRRVKWFQAKVATAQAGPVVVRIMMDFCRRVPTWNPMNQWAIEQLVDKALNAIIIQEEDVSPVKTLLKVFEIVSSGILLADGSGLRDPCEKEDRDCLEDVPVQELEDITNSAQHALRMIAFGQLRRVLNLQVPTEMLPTTPSQPDTSQDIEVDPSTSLAEAADTADSEAAAVKQPPANIPPAKRQKCSS